MKGQYIPKAAVVAEIERRIKKFREEKDSVSIVKTNTYKGILSFIDTLEVIEIGVDVGSPESDIGVKTIWHGDKIVSNKARKGE